MPNATVYGPDGATVLETLTDNGDGTGVRAFYDAGVIVRTEQVTDLPLPVPDPVDPVAALQAQVDQLTATLNALLGG